MNPMGLLYLVLILVLFVLLCYVILLVVERAFGPLDATIKSLLGGIVLIVIILVVLNHFGWIGPRW
jgi:hypothetical protein